MNQHKGMRPHDIVILCWIAAMQKEWRNLDLAKDLKISASEITYSLQRSFIAGLLDHSKSKVMKKTLLEFIQYGLPYVFPAQKGPLVVGMPTAHSAPVMVPHFNADEKFVWPDPNGDARGEAIEPLYPNAPAAAAGNDSLYAVLALLDVMRVGRLREKNVAMKLLSNKMDVAHA